MKFYLGIKFHEDLSNKDLIERICKIAEQQKHQIICDHRDLEEWGRISFSLEELMIRTFEIIENSDAVIIEFSESGVGLGVEAGFAVAKNIPVYILIPKGRVLSPTMQGICKKYFEYEIDEDIQQMFEIITDMDEKRKFDNCCDRNFFKKGIEDPKCYLLRFRTIEATFWIEGKFRTCKY